MNCCSYSSGSIVAGLNVETTAGSTLSVQTLETSAQTFSCQNDSTVEGACGSEYLLFAISLTDLISLMSSKALALVLEPGTKLALSLPLRIDTRGLSLDLRYSKLQWF